MSKYIAVKRDLSISIQNATPHTGAVISVRARPRDVLELPLNRLLYFAVLYPYVHKQDREAGKRGVKYRLAEPDAWLIGLAAIMWEGLIQGLTWDVIKASVLLARDKLRAAGLAPSPPASSRSKQKTGRSQTGFSWTTFSEDGKPLKELFVGIRREFNKCSEKERRAVRRNKQR